MDSFVAESTESKPSRGVRGRFLRRHNARIIEDGNVLVVEFVEKPWYTEAARRQHEQARARRRRRVTKTTAVITAAAAAGSGMMLLPIWQVALLGGLALSALITVVGVLGLM